MLALHSPARCFNETILNYPLTANSELFLIIDLKLSPPIYDKADHLEFFHLALREQIWMDITIIVSISSVVNALDSQAEILI